MELWWDDENDGLFSPYIPPETSTTADLRLIICSWETWDQSQAKERGRCRVWSESQSRFHSPRADCWRGYERVCGRSRDNDVTIRFDSFKVQVCTRARHWTRRTTDRKSREPQRRSVHHENQAVVLPLRIRQEWDWTRKAAYPQEPRDLGRREKLNRTKVS